MLNAQSRRLLLPLTVCLTVVGFSLTSAAEEVADAKTDPTQVQEEESGPPAIAPFTVPAPSRTLPPPSQLADLGGLDEPLFGGDEGSIEESILREALVETATKRPTKLNEVPMTVAWIPADELEGTGQFSLCDAIQYFPGMECRRGPMRKVAISARGLGSNFLSNRLLLLQDGRPYTDPWTSQFYGDETTPLTNVKQIEVIRGPGSSLYGSNAFSGVINIIRRDPSDLIKEGNNVGVDARVLAGQFNTLRLQTTGAGRAGDLEGLVNYYGYTTQGPELFNDASREITDHNQWANTHQVSSKVKYKALSVDAEYTTSGLGRPGGTQISTVGNCGRCHYTANDAEFVQSLNASAQFDMKATDNLRFFAQTYGVFKRRTVDLENMITGEMQPTLGKRNRVGAEVRALLSAGALNLTFGGDTKYDTVNNGNILAEFDPTDMRQTVFGAFSDAEFRLTRNLVVSGGVRYDHYQIPEQVWRNRSAQVSPRASVVFHAIPELVTLRTNYGRAFRAPSLAELAMNQQMYASTLIGNPFLQAETLDTVEAAVDVWPAGGAVRLTATGFYNNARNFINQQFVFGSTSQFQNVGDARVLGFEVEAAAQVRAINSSFDVAYQFLDAQSIVGGKSMGRLDYAPNHRIYFRGRTAFGKTAFAEFFGLWVGDRFDPGFNVDPQTGETLSRVQLPAYLVANARVGANVYEGTAVSLLASNIFNSQFQEVHGFPSSPVSLFAELKYSY